MPKGKIGGDILKPQEQFAAVNDLKLQMTLSALADRFNQKVRMIIYKTYQDDQVASIYRQIRNSGIYQHGSASKVHRKIIEFPNQYVYDFVDTVMSTMYGDEWMENDRALKHELVRPWWVVERL